MRAPPSARISPRLRRGSRLRPLISLDETLSTSGFQAGADLSRLGLVGIGTHHRAVVDAFGAKIDLVDEHRLAAEGTGVLALEGAVGGLGVRLRPLRGGLHRGGP